MIDKGTKTDIEEALRKNYGLNHLQAAQATTFILQHNVVFGQEDVILLDTETDDQPGDTGFLMDNQTWYINIRKTTLCLLLFLLGLQDGVTAASVLSGIGELTMANLIVSLKNEPGSGCLALELAKNRKKGMNLKELHRLYGRECFNHHLHCLRMEGLCRMDKDRLLDVLGFLETNGVVRKRFGRYYYQV